MGAPRTGIVATAIRLAICCLVFWLLFPADLFQTHILLALATALCLMTAYELSIRDVSPDGLLIAVAVILCGAAVTWAAWTWLFPPPPMPTGPLLPAGEVTPDAICAQPGDMVMAFGTDRVAAPGSGPFSPYDVEGCPGPVLMPTPKGLLISAIAYDYNNDIAFGVRNNGLQFVGAAVQLARPDRSTFVLLDRYGDEVLYVRYLNSRAVRIRGRVLCGGQPQAVIHDRAILMGGVRIGGAMFGQHSIPGHRCLRQTVNTGLHLGG